MFQDSELDEAMEELNIRGSDSVFASVDAPPVAAAGTGAAAGIGASVCRVHGPQVCNLFNLRNSLIG